MAAVRSNVDAFLKQNCLLAKNARYATYQLYLGYVRWCLHYAVPIQDQFVFVERLEAAGCTIEDATDDRVETFNGVSLLPRFR